ncbi:TAF4-domain-containing protein [Lentinula detonsa]|uniref:Transcription initiation factor TFIID subunit 4 n=1 Tax=Lentinula detonsa TaxID=2804962 RepID=A0AA38UPV2_9AGAR|nr:TAF4-domain-containing protein [Lentinula detonsa]
MNQPAKTDEIKPSTPAAQPITPQPVPTTYSTWAPLQAQPAPGASQVTQAGQPTPVYQYSPYSYYQSYQNQYAAITQVTTALTPTPVVAQSSTSTLSAAANSIDTSDINTLRDTLGSTGVDLRITSAHKLTNPHPSTDTVNYLALALRARLQDLITAMITAARHRTDTQFDSAPSMYEDGSPMWSILVWSDVAKQLAALKKVEREEETKIRRERKERVDMAAAQAAALAAQSVGSSNGGSGGGEDNQDGFGGGAKKKRKKDGPGVTVKNMSADVQKKMSNVAASHAAGLAGTIPMTSTTGNSPPQETSGEDTRTVITMRDAMFVIEKEKGHGGGRGTIPTRCWGIFQFLKKADYVLPT